MSFRWYLTSFACLSEVVAGEKIRLDAAGQLIDEDFSAEFSSADGTAAIAASDRGAHTIIAHPTGASYADIHRVDFGDDDHGAVLNKRSSFLEVGQPYVGPFGEEKLQAMGISRVDGNDVGLANLRNFYFRAQDGKVCVPGW